MPDIPVKVTGLDESSCGVWRLRVQYFKVASTFTQLYSGQRRQMRGLDCHLDNGGTFVLKLKRVKMLANGVNVIVFH